MKLPSKRLVSSGAVVLAVGTVLAWTSTWQQPGPRHFAFPFETAASAQTPPAITLTSEKYFKNVKAIVGVPVDDFMGEMGLYSAALSMCCGDCHVGAGTDNPEWASDKNPRKVLARNMQLMVNAINKEHFGGSKQITCWTCHRGSGNPSQTATIDQVYGDPLPFPTDVMKAAPPNTGVPTLDTIFNNYYKALGGLDKVNAIKSFSATGTSNLFGEVNNDPAEIYAKAPGQLAVVVHTKGGDSVRTTDGTHAWVKLPLTVVKEYPLTESRLEGGKLDAVVMFPGEIKGYFTNWRVSFPTSIPTFGDDGQPVPNGDKQVWAIQATGKDGLLASFYFDKQSGLLLRFVRMVGTNLGHVPSQIDYEDYSPEAGVMMPHKWIYGWISGREQYVIKSYQVNTQIAAKNFEEPLLVDK